MICTPKGMPSVLVGHIGAVTTGQPANEIGCVSKPMAARQGCCVPLMSSHSVPMIGALTGVAAVMSTSQSANSALMRSRTYTATDGYACDG